MRISILNYYVDTETTGLSLRNSGLKTVPVKKIKKLTKLEVLDLGNNYLTSLPVEICNFINLQKLYLYNNSLTSLPVEIGYLINLQELYLENNKLTSLPAKSGFQIRRKPLCCLKNLINLKVLYLQNNNLTSLPIEICNLINLEVLHLENNNLTSLPAEIGNLTNLKRLYLGNNNLTSLPEEILKIKDSLIVDETSYDIDNMDYETDILIFHYLESKITNLPITLKEIWLKEDINVDLIKLPFGCKIKYY